MKGVGLRVEHNHDSGHARDVLQRVIALLAIFG